MSKRNRQVYDSILTLVCRIIEYVLFIPTWEVTTIVDFAKLFYRHVIYYYGTLRGVVSDRDSYITSDFRRKVY